MRRLAVVGLAVVAILVATPPLQAQESTSRATTMIMGTVDAEWRWEPIAGLSPLTETVAPEVIQLRVPAAHPETARAGIQGHIIVEATISASGEVIEPRLIRGFGDAATSLAALAAAREWRFAPATRSGVPVATTVLVTFSHRVAVVGDSPVEALRELLKRAGPSR